MGGAAGLARSGRLHPDLLIHECIHVSVNVPARRGKRDDQIHHNPRWLAECERIGALLGFPFKGGLTITKRVPRGDGALGPSGKPKTKTIRITEPGADVEFDALSRFPHAVRAVLTDAGAYYRSRNLPFDNILTGPCHTQLDVTGKNGMAQ